MAGVRITGSVRVPEATIRDYIHTVVGQPYDAQRVREDFDRLLATGLFQDVKVEIAPVGERQVEVIFEVTEPPFVQDVVFLGLKEAVLSELQEHLRNSNLTIPAGVALDERRIQRVEREVKLFLEAKGFPLAKVELERAPEPTHAVRLIFHITEGPRARIGSIDFEGNHVFGDGELKQALRLSRPTSLLNRIRRVDRYIEEYLDFDIRNNVLPLYQARGYIFARAETPKVQLVEVKKGQSLRYDITIPLIEGQQYRYREFRVEGAEKIDPQRVGEAYQARPGDIVDFPALTRSNKEVERRYAERGFLDMRLTPDMRANHDNRTVAATIRIEEGERYLVRKIDFTGNERTRDKVLRREFQIDEQDPFDIRLLEQSIMRLNQLGFLEPITDRDYELRKDPARNEVDIVMRVKEKDQHAVNFEGGIWGISGSYAGVTYQSRNFRGLGELLELQLSPGTRTSIYSLSWTDPYWLDTRLTVGLTAYHQQLVYDTFNVLPDQSTQRLDLFNQRGTGFEATASYPLAKWNRLGIAYSLDNSRISSDDPAFRSYAISQLQLFNAGGDALSGIVRSQVAPYWVYNTRNQPFGATRGSYFFVRLPVAGGPLGGEIKVVHPLIEYRRYFADGLSRGRNTWAFRISAQHVLGYGHLSNGTPSPVPFLERIYLGGEQDLRGFDLRTVGPYAIHRTPKVDPEGNPIVDPETGAQLFDEQRVAIGGDTAAVFSAEYRAPIYGPIQVTPFVDVGASTILRKRDLRVSETGATELIGSTNRQWRMSTGAELQFLLPLVNQPFRLIFAYNPLRLETTAHIGSTDVLIREPKTNITFTIGYSF